MRNQDKLFQGGLGSPDKILMMNGERITIYREQEIAGIRVAAQAAASVLAQLCEAVRPGMTTLEVDQLAGEFIREAGGTSGSYNYHGYPGQICVSLNDEVVHGIGRYDRVIQFGDLVKLDVVVRKNGFYGDTARTVYAGGEPTGLAADLMAATQEALMAGIERAREGNCINDVGGTVQRVAENAGFSVVRDMIGHGCGKKMHEEPEVPNYRRSGHSPRLRPGMVICIEPMINAGDWHVNIDPLDHWTIRTDDGTLSAHFEHQILITEKEPEILTLWPKTV